ncbi:MAG TPA: hypothetical protein PKH77_08665 [Anaerolineae bacterium]|nr:hypothetical protein [Anaerolineae bacterium]
MKLNLDEHYCNYTYFTEQGWFASDYYYPVRLSKSWLTWAWIGWERR